MNRRQISFHLKVDCHFDLKKYTKLKINEIRSLIEICLSKCYFLWNNEIHELENSGPIGLSLMVVMAEGYLQVLEGKAIYEAPHEQPPIDLKTFRRYVDDSHARFPENAQAERFNEILNRQDPRIQYTIEKESEDKSIEFLDVKIMNNGHGKYEFDVHRKKAITNVQIKPSSDHDPKIILGVFKGFVHRAFKICSANYIEQELEFLVTVFIENGYKESDLRQTINEVRTKMNQSNAASQNIIDETESYPTISLPWIPGVSTKLKKVYKKAGYRAVFKSNANLQTILSAKNKVQLPKNSLAGVYKIPCKCKNVPPYIGETKLQINTRFKQHESYVNKGQWENSGAAKHAMICKKGFEGIETIKVETNRFDRCVREAIEIQRHGSGPNDGGMNLDDGKYVKTKFWLPFLRYITEQESKKQQKQENRAQRGNLTSTSNNNEDNI